MKNYLGKISFFGDVLTKDLYSDDMLSFAVAVFSHQLVVALVLPDGFWDGDLGPQSRPVHLKTRRQKANVFIYIAQLIHKAVSMCFTKLKL